MKIVFGYSNNTINKSADKRQIKNFFNGGKYTNLSPLQKDIVSFKGEQKTVKKSDFKGLDFATVEKYRVDISKFQSTDELQDWANEKIKTITEKNFGGRQQETVVQRKAMLKEWVDYVTKENDAYTPVMQLAILETVTKDLKQNSDDIPPVLNKGVLADTMTEYIKRLNENPKENINLNKLYRNKLNAFYYGTNKDGQSNTDFTGWIVIPSKTHDPENFEANVNKLKALSHKNWCTKSFNAEPYLSEGDFHVYLENGQPKLGVRFGVDWVYGDVIVEIQSEQNNSKIPVKYLQTVKQHIEKNKLTTSDFVESEIAHAEEIENEINIIKNRFEENALKKSEADVILPYFGIDVEKDKDGKFIIANYSQPSGDFTYDDLGIDENKLLKNVKEVKRDIDLRYSKATNLENLERVGRRIVCDGRRDLNLKNLKSVLSAHFDGAKNINLESLKEVGEYAHFEYVENLNIPNIEKIGKFAHFTGSKINNLDSLKECGSLEMTYSTVQSMKNLEDVSGNLTLNTIIKSLPKLREVSGSIKNTGLGSKLEEMPNLEIVGENFEINCPNLKKLNSLKSVGGYFRIWEDSELEEMNNLEKVGRTITVENQKLLTLPKLKTVGENLDIRTNSQLSSLGNLEFVGSSVYSVNNNLSDLHSLKRVGCGLVITNTKVSDLNNLEFVGGIADLEGTPIEKLENLKEVGGFLGLRRTKITNPHDYEKIARNGVIA